MPKQQNVGIALGGGGARGFAHLGVLLALEENGIPIDIITGTSMGAGMGAVKALGMDLRKVERILNCLNLNSLLQVSDSTLREVQRTIGRGMVEYVRGARWRQEGTAPENLDRMSQFFSLLTANKSFSDLQIPFAAVAADLESGERVVLTAGKLYLAMAASAAVPGVFPPVLHEGRYLVDGGVIDKIPANVAIDLGAEILIAVDTSAPLTRSVKTSLDVLFQSQRITSQHLTALQLAQARDRLDGRFLLLHPDVEWITMLAFEHFPEAVQAGKEEALAHMDEIKRLCAVALSPRS
ncbi:MAG: patatin-like phospholipase family protein [Candidatus Bipolaricaulota bacterium]|nr:patatin-like phospholipase family protein [Candidatus Bipolaricaulota bacterium]